MDPPRDQVSTEDVLRDPLPQLILVIWWIQLMWHRSIEQMTITKVNGIRMNPKQIRKMRVGMPGLISQEITPHMQMLVENVWYLTAM